MPMTNFLDPGWSLKGRRGSSANNVSFTVALNSLKRFCLGGTPTLCICGAFWGWRREDDRLLMSISFVWCSPSVECIVEDIVCWIYLQCRIIVYKATIVRRETIFLILRMQGNKKAKALYTAPNHGKDCFFSLSFVSYFINIQKQPTKLEILKLKIRTICIFSCVCCKFYQTKVQFSWKFVKEKAN